MMNDLVETLSPGAGILLNITLMVFIIYMCCGLRRMDSYLDELMSSASDGLRPGAPAVPSTGAASASAGPPVLENMHERLAVVVCGGQSSELLGRQYTTNQIEALGDDELQKLSIVKKRSPQTWTKALS